jgi:hypothetical protein
MPTTYKAVRDHRPLEWTIAAERIRRFLDEHLETLARLGRGDSTDLEEDALVPLREHIELFLIQFLSQYSARPSRSPNKLEATLRHIVRKPDEFIKDVSIYDPEVVEWVYGAHARQSPEHKREVLLFEIGRGSLSREAVSAAATAAIEEIKRINVENKKGGRPKDDVLNYFASRAVRLFEAAGGTATATSGNQFWRFVELLREPVLKAAKEAGCSLTVDSVVRKAVMAKAKRR